MTMLRVMTTAILGLTLALAVLIAPTLSYAAGPSHATRIASGAKLKPGWYCIIWERMSDGSWVCRLQEKRS